MVAVGLASGSGVAARSDVESTGSAAAVGACSAFGGSGVAAPDPQPANVRARRPNSAQNANTGLIRNRVSFDTKNIFSPCRFGIDCCERGATVPQRPATPLFFCNCGSKVGLISVNERRRSSDSESGRVQPLRLGPAYAQGFIIPAPPDLDSEPNPPQQCAIILLAV